MMSATARPMVLVTGAAGYIAAQIMPALRERFDLRLVDVRAEDRNGVPVPGVVVHDLRDPDLEAHRALFHGVDAVVHLAYYRGGYGEQGGYQRRSYFAERTNVDMAYTVFQLALEEGARRVVMASSNHAADWYERLIHARQKDVVLPGERPLAMNYYGWAKAAYEHMGFLYAQGALGQPLGVVQVRIGAPRNLADRDYAGLLQDLKRDLGAYVSPRDLAQLFCRALEAPRLEDEHGVPFQIVYGISNNTRAFWSLANARRVLGYAPDDDSEHTYASLIEQLLAGSPGRVGA